MLSGLLVTPGVPVCLHCLVYVKDCYFEFILICVFLVPPRCVHHDSYNVMMPLKLAFKMMYFNSIYFLLSAIIGK